MINKVGTSEKILEVAKSSMEFAEMWGKIEKTNDLQKCTNCKHLISKQSDNVRTIKHKKLAVLITGGSIKILCPVCGTVNSIK